jgi:C4-type Zn-finger protein
VIHEEDEEGGSVMQRKNIDDEFLSKEEEEMKRKGIRDLIFKSEYNLGGILNRTSS